MNKIIVLIFFLINTLWANLGTNEDLRVLKNLGLESSFISDSELVDIFNEYSSSKKISYYRSILRKSSLNAQVVRTEIDNENLPEAIFFIPMIETSFVNHVRGKNSPAGLWQIMPATAKHLKLRNDEFIDERLDLIKSTDAASSYLKRYYKKFDKWYLSILAYNCGEGRVIEGLTRASLDMYIENNPNKSTQILKSYQRVLDDYKRTKNGVSKVYGVYGELQSLEVPFSLEYLIENNKQREYLPESSLSYLKKVAVFSMLSSRDLFEDIKKAPYRLEKVKAQKNIQLKSIASAINMNSSEFANINKHIRKQVLPKDSKNFNIYIPKNKLELYNKNIANIKPVIDKKVEEVKKNKVLDSKKNKDEKKIVKDDKKKALIYTVKKGDSFESIAKAYKISVKKLKSDNKKKSNLIDIGDKIEIYK
ncbi:transglycosylase SLT domain-containing protein [Arcobacter sp. s6]|uniref:LysM peptidoglycan-binding domain-containing protein n=1 Tax=Arcobacter sp. s6 TaxID=3230363 RepID=UPI0034A07DD5